MSLPSGYHQSSVTGSRAYITLDAPVEEVDSIWLDLYEGRTISDFTTVSSGTSPVEYHKVSNLYGTVTKEGSVFRGSCSLSGISVTASFYVSSMILISTETQNHNARCETLTSELSFKTRRTEGNSTYIETAATLEIEFVKQEGIDVFLYFDRVNTTPPYSITLTEKQLEGLPITLSGDFYAVKQDSTTGTATHLTAGSTTKLVSLTLQVKKEEVHSRLGRIYLRYKRKEVNICFVKNAARSFPLTQTPVLTAIKIRKTSHSSIKTTFKKSH